MSKEAPIFPLFYCGPISYYSKLFKLSNLQFEIQEHFTKQTYRNRMRILSANGVLNLSIPIQKDGGKIKMEDAKISYKEDWQKDHWNSIEAAYNSSPFFEFYDYLFRELYQTKFEKLIENNLAFHKLILKCLETNFSFRLTDRFNPLTFNDLRTFFSSKSSNSIGAQLPTYRQTFQKQQFIADLSILDLLFNLGPEARLYLLKCG